MKEKDFVERKGRREHGERGVKRGMQVGGMDGWRIRKRVSSRI